MSNHVIGSKVTARMYVTPDGKHVIHETIITDKRPLRYYTGQLLKDVKKKAAKKKVSKKKRTKKRKKK